MKIEVHAGPHARICCPVRATLPIASPAALCLRESDTGQVVPCQWLTDGDETVLTWIIDALDAEDSRVYVAAEEDSPQPTPTVSLQDADQKVEVVSAGEPFTTYHYDTAYARPFLYPVVGPYGHGITRGYPMDADVPGEKHDHPHHRSLYTAFGDVNGVDDWSEGKGHGRIVHKQFSAVASGPVYARIVAENDWVGNDGTLAVAETREMVFYNTPPDTRLLDYAVTFHTADEPVVIGDTKEGGILSVRVATSMDVNSELGGQIRNAYGGINEQETWGKPSPWCDYSGPVAGRIVGLAVLDHPDNPRYPTQWHVRNYGLMTANCFGWSYYQNDKSIDGSYTIPPQTDVTFQYRVYIHAGWAEHVSDQFINFAFPPQATVET